MQGGSRAALVLALLAIPSAAGLTWILASGASQRAEDEAASLRERVRSLESEAAARPTAAREGAGKAEPAAPADAGTTGAAAAPSPPRAPAPAGDRVDRLRAEVERAVGAGEGEAALAALKALLDLQPEGREASMALVIKVRRAMEDLGIREMRWSGFIASSRLPELMEWAFANPSPEAFREFAAWSLPWREPPEATVRRFETAFPKEESLDVAKALAQQAAVLDTEASRAALARFVQDTAADPVLRAVAATELARTGSEEALRLLREIAGHDADAAIREAARTAALAADPPCDGYLVTMIAEGDPWSEAGLRAGDVVTSFDGRAVGGPEPDDFLWKGISGAQEAGRTPRVEVLRGGQSVVLHLPAEFPVIVGMPVRRRE